MNNGQFSAFINRMDRIEQLLEQIALDIAPKQRPPKQRKQAKQAQRASELIDAVIVKKRQG